MLHTRRSFLKLAGASAVVGVMAPAAFAPQASSTEDCTVTVSMNPSIFMEGQVWAIGRTGEFFKVVSVNNDTGIVRVSILG